MAIETIGEVEFEFHGKTYTLKPDFAFIAAVEDRYGAIMSMARRWQADDFKITEIEGVLWTALSRLPDRPTRKQLQDAFDDLEINHFLVPALTLLLNALLKGTLKRAKKESEKGEVEPQTLQ